MSPKGQPAPAGTGDEKRNPRQRSDSQRRAEMKTRRQIERQKRQRKRTITLAALALVGLAAVAALAYAAINLTRNAIASSQPPIGTEVPAMPDTSNYPEGEPLPLYSTNPPTSGPHYESTYEAGFYDETRVASLTRFYEGYLVHNLENGYVIIWYNCNLLDRAGCTSLKAQIQETMDRAGGKKVIAFPWRSLKTPVVLSSWGRILPMETFDSQLALEFVERNRNKSPEPDEP